MSAKPLGKRKCNLDGAHGRTVLDLATGKYGCRKVRVYPAECGEHLGSPSHLRPVILKPVSRMFEISDSKPDTGKMRKMRTPLPPQENKV